MKPLQSITWVYREQVLGRLILTHRLTPSEAADLYDAATQEAFDDRNPKECADWLFKHWRQHGH